MGFMYLAPLNYDRYFKKVFSDIDIAKRFLEDFFDTKIESIELLSQYHKVTDDASAVEFDFRCKIDNEYVIIDMQQWYKPDIIQRFYVYHAINTALQLEK
ncbi:MAG: Rpn family recombination-promoting nuclease/putative transposase, partial [Bacteroidetes bacterium]|nr:Rpn family recombination-promoting nuclease/putative transposase [Bacteroidota bacterium]